MVALILLTFLFALAAAHNRTYLYVGGKYITNEDGEHIFTDQMYVEKLTPARASKSYPIVFVHGNGQTGTNWLNKPDGTPGWASYFLSQGYECYILDQTFRGRSPWTPDNGSRETFSAEHVQQYFTAGERYKIWPQAHLHTQWPGTGVMGDPVFDAYYASTVPSVADQVVQESAVQKAGAQLLDVIGKPVILIAHSQGGPVSWGMADARAQLVRSFVAIEPAGPPFRDAAFGNADPARAYGLTNIPITYSPAVTDPAKDFVRQTIPANATGHLDCLVQAEDPAPRQLVNLRRFPVLLMTTESSYHAQYDWCTVRFLRQAGVKTDHLELGKAGIHGNGHMVFLEKNSDEVAGAVLEWLEQEQEHEH